MNEKYFLNSDKVKISSVRIVINGNTYVTNKINSVKIKQRDPTRSLVLPGAVVFVGIIWLFGSLIAQPFNILGHLIPLALIAGSVWWIWQTQDEYCLILSTSSGEETALVSEKINDLVQIEKAIVEAIGHRN